MEFDYLIVGNGIAGLSMALKVSPEHTVAILAKNDFPESNSAYAQGGVASVWSAEDSFESHVQDTLKAGVGLCDVTAVETVVREGPQRVRELISAGTQFSKEEGSEGADYDLGLEGGHSHRRILHAADATGREIIRALLQAVRLRRNVTFLEKHIAIDLLVSSGGRGRECWGAYVLDQHTGEVKTIHAQITALCSGGAGKVYLYTSNPDVATGDGVAMAFRAGVPIANMEFFQFHPTCLFHPDAKSFLISEALRGEGGILRRPGGAPFMRRYHPLAELAPRDIVARAIDCEMKQNGLAYVELDVSHLEAGYLRRRFPTIFSRCQRFGVDLTKQAIPVVPAAHYMCGGVVTDLHGRTKVRRLFAVGEVAMTGVHGANRLASNSLLEALVFAHRAAESAAAILVESNYSRPSFPDWNPGAAVRSNERVVLTHTWEEVRRLMWDYVGVIRSDAGLGRARRRLDIIREEIRDYYWEYLVTADLVELRNLVTVSQLVIDCASIRKETRGLHASHDYPEDGNANWAKNTIVNFSESSRQIAPIDFLWDDRPKAKGNDL